MIKYFLLLILCPSLAVSQTLLGGTNGNLPVTNLNSGTNASGTTAWFGDGTWKAVSGGTVSAITTPNFFFTSPVAITGGTAALSFNNNFTLNTIPYFSGTNTMAALTIGTNLSITSGTLNATAGGSGTVTSVAGAGTVSGLTLTGTVTSSGTLTLGGAITGFAAAGANSDITSMAALTSLNVNTTGAGTGQLRIAAANNNTGLRLQGGATSGQSFGQLILAGVTSGDYALSVFETTGNTQLFKVFGDGGVSIGTTTDPGAGNLLIQNNLISNTVGKGLQIKGGTNARIGSGTLVSGSLAIGNTSITANSRIFVQDTTTGSLVNVGTLIVPSSLKLTGTGFSVTSSNALDTSTFDYWIVEQN